MSEKDYNKLLELAKELLHEDVSKDEDLRSFVRAGILDENGNLTPPYTCLEVPASKQ